MNNMSAFSISHCCLHPTRRVNGNVFVLADVLVLAGILFIFIVGQTFLGSKHPKYIQLNIENNMTSEQPEVVAFQMLRFVGGASEKFFRINSTIYGIL